MDGGSFGLGSLGVPSTRAQRPIVLSQPTMLLSTQVWSYAPCRMMDSRTRTPAPMATPFPMETFGPTWSSILSGSRLIQPSILPRSVK
uniref:Uncharacterized protein n=1 Tax=Naja naja TaxID=35670 RepID=A0A8C6V8R1_NAJNA